MLGVVLCGGNSSRMGIDKGLLEVESGSWAKIAADKIAKLKLSVAISVNERQAEKYSAVFPDTKLIVDDSTLNIRGPLYGVLSVHIQNVEEDLMILACDMPLIETNLLETLMENYNTNPTADAIIFSVNNEPEPLCGIYKCKGLAKILNLYNSKKLEKHSMKYMLEQISTLMIPVKTEYIDSLKNFNAHADLNGL